MVEKGGRRAAIGPKEGITETLRQKQLRVSCQAVCRRVGVEARASAPPPMMPPLAPPNAPARAQPLWWLRVQ